MNMISVIGVQLFLHNIVFILPCQPVMMTDPMLRRTMSPNMPAFLFVDVFCIVATMKGVIMSELVPVTTHSFLLNQAKNTSPLQLYPQSNFPSAFFFHSLVYFKQQSAIHMSCKVYVYLIPTGRHFCVGWDCLRPVLIIEQVTLCLVIYSFILFMVYIVHWLAAFLHICLMPNSELQLFHVFIRYFISIIQLSVSRGCTIAI